MCGIAGMMMRDAAEVSVADLDVMGGALVHRGPDGAGHYVRGSIGFRHDRLAIIDLSTGDQPLFDDRDRALVVNGEIYNYIELKAAMPDADGARRRIASPCSRSTTGTASTS